MTKPGTKESGFRSALYRRHVVPLLRLEGLAVLGLTILLYQMLDASWLLFALLFLVPDLSFLAYLHNPRTGALAYNALHTYIVPLTLGGASFVLQSERGVAIALIWLTHIGFDRVLGYGLKFPSAFKDTHLNVGTSPHRD